MMMQILHNYIFQSAGLHNTNVYRNIIKLNLNFIQSESLYVALKDELLLLL